MAKKKKGGRKQDEDWYEASSFHLILNTDHSQGCT